MLIRGLTVKGIEVRSTSSAISSDEYFNLVSLLLPGTGTNGAQNNTFVDGSTNNFTVTRNGNTTQGTFSPFSQTGWSNYFDGSGDSISAPDNAALEFGSGDFTIEASVYLTAYSSSYSGFYGTYVVARDANSGRSYTFYITATVSSFTGIGFVTFDGSGNANLNFAASASLNLNTWYHIAVSRSGTTFRLFLNGSLIGSTTSAVSILDTAVPTRIGAGAYSGFEYYFTGYISNVRIVKGTAVYTSAFTPPSAPLTAISGTSLLTCQSNRFVDNSANAFVITVAGNVSVQAFAPFDPTTAYSAAAVGGSGYFDGSGDYLSIPDNDALDGFTGDFTIEFWVYFTSVAGGQVILDKGWNTSSTFSPYLFYMTSSNLQLYAAATGAGSWNIVGGTVIISSAVPNTWYHVAVSRSGSTIGLYQNGTQVTTITSSSTFLSNASPVTVGRPNADSSYFNGYISGLRIVKGTAVYTSAFTPPTTPPTAVANTSLLLNYTNGGITDATAKNALETVGGAAISTAQSKFGGSSMAFDGTTDYVVQPSSLNYGYGTGDFTIEFWLYLNSTGLQTIVSNLSAATGGVQPHIYINTTIRYYTNSADRITGAALSAGQWYHIAVSRGSGSTRLFVNGTQSGSTYADTNNYTTAPLGVGTYWEAGVPITTSTLNGYIDDLRITKGLARYTTTFTPPTQAFPTQ
jgi:hypothetical protein